MGASVVFPTFEKKAGALCRRSAYCLSACRFRAGLFGVGLFAGIASFAQGSAAHNDFEVDVAAGYRFQSGLKTSHYDSTDEAVSSGRLTLDDGLVLSGIFGYRIQPDGFIYLSYSRQELGYSYDPKGNTAAEFSGDATLEYFQFGGNVEMTRGIMVPYFGFSVGMARLASLGGGGSRLFFAPVLDGGLKFDLHKHIHLRLIGRVPIFFANKEVFCSGDDCAYADEVRPTAQLHALAGLGVSF